MHKEVLFSIVSGLYYDTFWVYSHHIYRIRKRRVARGTKLFSYEFLSKEKNEDNMKKMLKKKEKKQHS